MHQILFWLGLCPRPLRGRLQRLPRTTGSEAGLLLRGMGGAREGRAKEGRGLRKGREGS